MCEVKSVLRTHQAAGRRAELFIVCDNGLQQKHTGQQELGYLKINVITVDEENIFHITEIFIKMEKVKKTKQLITAFIHSFRVLLDLALCLPPLCPES